MKKLTIALVAHDNRKAEMVEWAVHNAEFLSHHHIVCTGTTGNLVRKALEENGVNADIACNRYSADLMITSTLWDDDTYFPTEPKYVHFNRE